MQILDKILTIIAKNTKNPRCNISSIPPPPYTKKFWNFASVSSFYIFFTFYTLYLSPSTFLSAGTNLAASEFLLILTLNLPSSVWRFLRCWRGGGLSMQLNLAGRTFSCHIQPGGFGELVPPNPITLENIVD